MNSAKAEDSSDSFRLRSIRELLNFALTNGIPRRMLTRLIGRFSQIESPWLTRASIAVWQCFVDDLCLDEARQAEFSSLQQCFIRELRDGARPIDSRHDCLTSPCDAIVGAYGRVQRGQLLQIKGMPYALFDLLQDADLVRQYEGCSYVTLRLKSSMYHRFHAPCTGDLKQVRYISGDVWNVNPPTLRWLRNVFCRNERAVLPVFVENSATPVTIVAVAAVLVSSMRLTCISGDWDVRVNGDTDLNKRITVNKGQELGYFQHGSTIIMFAPADFEFVPTVVEGERINMGQALMQRVVT